MAFYTIDGLAADIWMAFHERLQRLAALEPAGGQVVREERIVGPKDDGALR